MSNGGTTSEVEAQIQALRQAQIATRRERANAERLENDAIHAELFARTARRKAQLIQRECDELDAWFAGELEILVQEIVALIPRPRNP